MLLMRTLQLLQPQNPAVAASMITLSSIVLLAQMALTTYALIVAFPRAIRRCAQVLGHTETKYRVEQRNGSDIADEKVFAEPYGEHATSSRGSSSRRCSSAGEPFNTTDVDAECRAYQVSFEFVDPQDAGTNEGMDLPRRPPQADETAEDPDHDFTSTEPYSPPVGVSRAASLANSVTLSNDPYSPPLGGSLEDSAENSPRSSLYRRLSAPFSFRFDSREISPSVSRIFSRRLSRRISRSNDENTTELGNSVDYRAEGADTMNRRMSTNEPLSEKHSPHIGEQSPSPAKPQPTKAEEIFADIPVVLEEDDHDEEQVNSPPPTSDDEDDSMTSQ